MLLLRVPLALSQHKDLFELVQSYVAQLVQRLASAPPGETRALHLAFSYSAQRDGDGTS